MIRGWLLEYNREPSDAWLRAEMRGNEPEPPPHLQRVILDSAKEADRIYHALASLKYLRNSPMGGASLTGLFYCDGCRTPVIAGKHRCAACANGR